MKIHLVINNEIETTEIHIHAKEYNEQIEQLMKQLQATQSPTMINGYFNQDIHMLKVDEIYSIYAEGPKVYLQTEEQEFEAKKKLYELEAQLAKDFVRVNKSTLINLNKITSIQLATLSSTQALLENGVSIHISRKYIKELKSKLGIGKER
ncbi:LytTR family DNA-binding domain-containing protein [Solibacillus sp. FSL R7-0668]|uniref:LytTR family DNA-binding domain-containing protein n=1 Tax=Solibacillus sp. FSL R7-0668 TaxID=2921688 RepID=UPI0030FC1965